jgi:hypothetical protein
MFQPLALGLLYISHPTLPLRVGMSRSCPLMQCNKSATQR